MAAAITASMGKLSMGEKSSIEDKKSRSSPKDETALVTVGRWQGPHMGHFLLIDELYKKAVEMGHAEAFVYVTDKITVKPATGWVHDNWEEYNGKNPLTGIQKLYYLSLMFPKDRYSEDKFKFLVGFNQNDIMQGLLDNWTQESFPYRVSTGFSIDALKLLYNTKPEDGYLSPDGINLFQKRKNLQTKPFGKRIIRLTPSAQERSPSMSCINIISKRGYKTMELLVGSDRVGAFKTFNSNALEDGRFIEAGKVGQLGGDRGKAGSGTLFKMDVPSGEDEGEEAKDKRKSIGIAMDFCEGTGEEKSCMSTITDGMFSGTNVRHYAYNFLSIQPDNVKELCEAIKIGNMTPLDCLCYVNDIRNGGGKGINKLPITVEDWNTSIASCGDICEKYLIDVDVEVIGLLVENKGITEKVAIAFGEGEEPEVGVEKEEEPPMPSPEKFKYDRIAKIWDVNGQQWLFENKGGTRKKKKKRRRRKTKRNHKRRKNKHSRKRKRKRRRKRKTRRN